MIRCIGAKVFVVSIFPVFSAVAFGAMEGVDLQASLRGKETLPHSASTGFPIIELNTQRQQCISACFEESKQAPIGYDAIAEMCNAECDFVEALQDYNNKPKGERSNAVKILCAHNGDSRAVAPLIEALQHDIDERTGLWAWIIPALGASQDSRATAILIRALTINDDSWLGREMAAHALGQIGDVSSVPFLVDAAWRGDTRDAAIEALSNYLDERAAPALISALGPDEDPQTREFAMRGLHNLGPAAVPELAKFFVSYSPEYPQTQERVSVCQLLGSSGDKRALVLLKQHTHDADKAVGDCARKYSMPD